MPESNTTATGSAKTSSARNDKMPEITEPYLREQLEVRRTELSTVIQEGASSGPCQELLHEVDAAIERMENGSFGICEVCHDPVEKERLLADPLARLCLDHLSSDEQRALERDLELAARVQRRLLPQSNVQFRDWQIRLHYKPAGLVSGDYCDLIVPEEEDGKLVFLLGDVSGKGVAASLLMTHLHAMFRSLASAGLDLEKSLDLANRVFCESTIAGQYATLICGRAGHSGDIEFASAGHIPALHVTRRGAKEIPSTGVPLGMFSKSSYSVRRVTLDPGDCLLLYTDGISEANNPSGKEYGVSRLAQFAGSRHNWAPDDLLTASLQDIEEFAAGTRQRDDQTLMVLHRNGVGSKGPEAFA